LGKITICANRAPAQGVSCAQGKQFPARGVCQLAEPRDVVVCERLAQAVGLGARGVRRLATVVRRRGAGGGTIAFAARRLKPSQFEMISICCPKTSGAPRSGVRSTTANRSHRFNRVQGIMKHGLGRRWSAGMLASVALLAAEYGAGISVADAQAVVSATPRMPLPGLALVTTPRSNMTRLISRAI
jgi:hypothetical protein